MLVGRPVICLPAVISVPLSNTTDRPGVKMWKFYTIYDLCRPFLRHPMMCKQFKNKNHLSANDDFGPSVRPSEPNGLGRVKRTRARLIRSERQSFRPAPPSKRRLIIVHYNPTVCVIILMYALINTWFARTTFYYRQLYENRLLRVTAAINNGPGVYSFAIYFKWTPGRFFDRRLRFCAPAIVEERRQVNGFWIRSVRRGRNPFFPSRIFTLLTALAGYHPVDDNRFT